MYVYILYVYGGGGVHVYVLRLYVCNACVYMHGVLSYGYCLGAMRYDILHAIAYCTTLCYTMPVCVLCYATMYYVVICYTVLCCTVLCYSILCYACVQK
jgi:hypothetical protein